MMRWAYEPIVRPVITYPSVGEKEDETAEHFLCNCDAFSYALLTFMDFAYPRTENFKSENIRKARSKINSRLNGIMYRYYTL